MKSFIRLVLLFSMILVSLLVFSDGQCQIVRRPVIVDGEMDVSFKIPDFLMEKVQSKLKEKNIHIEGRMENVWKIKDMDERRSAVKLIYGILAEEVTKMLDWFTSVVIQMIELRKHTFPLGTLLEMVGLMVVGLNNCLEHLYNNEANVTKALDRYLFLSDIISVYRAEYDTDTDGSDIQKEKVLQLIKKKIDVKLLPTGNKNVVQKSFVDLYNEATWTIFSFTVSYNQSYGCVWLKTDQLKWKDLMKSGIVQHVVSPISKKSLQKRYDEIAAEVDSTKVLAFYAEVVDAFTEALAQKTLDVYSLFVKYLQTMIESGSSEEPFINVRLTAVNVVLLNQLRALDIFENQILHSSFPLECSAGSLIKINGDLHRFVERGIDFLKNEKMSKQHLLELLVYVNPDYVKPMVASYPSVNQPDIAGTITQTTEKLVKIIKAIRAILYETIIICRLFL